MLVKPQLQINLKYKITVFNIYPVKMIKKDADNSFLSAFGKKTEADKIFASVSTLRLRSPESNHISLLLATSQSYIFSVGLESHLAFHYSQMKGTPIEKLQFRQIIDVITLLRTMLKKKKKLFKKLGSVMRKLTTSWNFPYSGLRICHDGNARCLLKPLQQ